MTPRSDYNWGIKEGILVIEDLNLGRMSVTNNAEGVISEIYSQIGAQLHNLDIIYKDSEGIWDQLIPSWGVNECVEVSFKYLGETNLEIAIKKIKDKTSTEMTI
jgi:hypothetical protein